MEWLVPILFVLASLAQWWAQRNRQEKEDGQTEASSAQDHRERPAPSRQEPPPQEEFGDLGDLLEALGRRRHESPPQTVEPTEPPVLPSPPPKRVAPQRREPATPPVPEPLVVLEAPKPALDPVFTAFPEARVTPISETKVVFPTENGPNVSFRPFPSAKKAGFVSTCRWSDRLRSQEATRDAIVLSEILAPPVSLR